VLEEAEGHLGAARVVHAQEQHDGAAVVVFAFDLGEGGEALAGEAFGEEWQEGLVVGALGVVFGDIGTSPIYTIRTVFNPADPHRVPISANNVFGVVSLVFWSVMIIVTLTYVTLVMRMSNEGEAGIMALITLLRRWGGPRRRRTAATLAARGSFGAALFFGDSMITPAISVLSAMEGLKVVRPGLAELIVPITAVIVLPFAFQRRGTAAVGRLFGPLAVRGELYGRR
jgi:KUP system potassium uptake protein